MSRFFTSSKVVHDLAELYEGKILSLHKQQWP